MAQRGKESAAHARTPLMRRASNPAAVTLSVTLEGKSLKGALVYGRPVDYAPTSTRVFVALDGDCYASATGETGRTLRQTDAGDCCFACWGIRVSRAVLQEYRPILVYAVGGRIKQTALLPSLLSHKLSNAESVSGWKVRLPIQNGFLNR